MAARRSCLAYFYMVTGLALSTADKEEASLPMWGDALGSLLDARAQEAVTRDLELESGMSYVPESSSLVELTVDVTSSLALDNVDPYEFNADVAARTDFKTALATVVKSVSARAVQAIEASEVDDSSSASVVTFALTVDASGHRAEAAAEVVLDEVKADIFAAIRDGALQEVLRASRSATGSSLDAAQVLAARSLKLVEESTATFSAVGEQPSSTWPQRPRTGFLEELHRHTDEEEQLMLAEEDIEKEIRRLQTGSFSFSFSYDNVAAPTPSPSPSPTMSPTRAPTVSTTFVATITQTVCPAHFSGGLSYVDSFDDLDDSDDEKTAYLSVLGAAVTINGESLTDLATSSEVTFAEDSDETDFCEDEGLTRKLMRERRKLEDSNTPTDTATAATSEFQFTVSSSDSSSTVASDIESQLSDSFSDGSICEDYEDARETFTTADFTCGLTDTFTVDVVEVDFSPTETPTYVPTYVPTYAPTGINLATLVAQACTEHSINYGHRFELVACPLITQTLS